MNEEFGDELFFSFDFLRDKDDKGVRDFRLAGASELDDEADDTEKLGVMLELGLFSYFKESPRLIFEVGRVPSVGVVFRADILFRSTNLKNSTIKHNFS